MSTVTAPTPRVQRRRGNVLAPVGSMGKSRDKPGLYHCNYCSKDISNRIRIKCAVCLDFDLCLECFSVGAEIRPHKNNHAYRVVDNLSFPVFEPTWGADEELLLLEAVDMFGLGNWAAISEHVGTKQQQDCKDHYFTVYINHNDNPEPKPTQEMVAYEQQAPRDKFGRQAVMKIPGKGMLVAPQASATPRAATAVGTQQDLRHGATAAAAPQTGAGTTTAGPFQPPGSSGVAASASESQKPHQPAAHPALGSPSARPASETARHQAAVKKAIMHEKKAVKTVKEEAEVKPTNQLAGASERTASPTQPHVTNAVGLSPHPPPKTAAGAAAAASSKKAGVELSLRNTLEVTGYNAKRNEFEPECDNEAEMVIADIEFTEGEPEAEHQQKLRMLDIYNMRLDLREKRKAIILDKGFLDVRAAESKEKASGPIEQMLHSQLRVFARFHSTEEHEQLVHGLAVEHHLRARIQELKQSRRDGIRKLVDAEVHEHEKRRRIDSQQPSTAGRGERGARGSDSGGALQALNAGKEHKPNPIYDGRHSPAALLSWRTMRGAPLDIVGLPGVDRLSRLERGLCATIRLAPAHYLVAKETLIRQSQTRGYVTRAEARSLLRMDAVKVTRLHDLLHKEGWIRTTPLPQTDHQPAPIVAATLTASDAPSSATN